MPSSIEVQIIQKGRGTAKGINNYNYQNDLDGSQTLEQFLETNKMFTLDVAREARSRAEKSGGFDKDARTRTDNVFDRPDEQVRPLGKIEYFARAEVGEAIIDFYEQVTRRSPEVTGQYKSGNVLFFNGIKVADTPQTVKLWVRGRQEGKGFSANDTIRIVNVNPYARKMEYLGVRRGTTGQFKGQNQNLGRKRVNKRRGNKTVRVLKPQGTYTLAFRSIRNRYKSIANLIKFTFMPNGTDGIFIEDQGPGFRNKFTPRKGAKLTNRQKGQFGRPYLYPSIIIKLSGAGITGEVINE